MDLQLEGKRALVTGSTKGIGKAIAAALAAEGAHVIVNGRSEGSTRAAAESLTGSVEGIPADLSSAEGCAQLAEAAGAVDVLVNNFGIFAPQPFEEIEDATWLKFYEANVLSGVRLSRALLPGMRERGWGRILFVSSESAINIPGEMIHYGMTKTAQLSVSRGLAKHAAGSGVTVNAILPGPTWTEGVEDFVSSMAAQEGASVADMKAGFVAEHRPSSLIQRWATPEEVASLAVYLCSPLAAAISGTAQRVEGGIVDTCF